jgi:hypothetical protein
LLIPAAGGLFVALAHAEPPPGADPALAPWFQSLKQPGTGALCCSMADCRTVRTRSVAGHLEAWIGAPDFRNAPEAWVAVPEAVMIRGVDNPNGEPVACWYGGQIRCFVEASGT